MPVIVSQRASHYRLRERGFFVVSPSTFELKFDATYHNFKYVSPPTSFCLQNANTYLASVYDDILTNVQQQLNTNSPVEEKIEFISAHIVVALLLRTAVIEALINNPKLGRHKANTILDWDQRAVASIGPNLLPLRDMHWMALKLLIAVVLLPYTALKFFLLKPIATWLCKTPPTFNKAEDVDALRSATQQMASAAGNDTSSQLTATIKDQLKSESRFFSSAASPFIITDGITPEALVAASCTR